MPTTLDLRLDVDALAALREDTRHRSRKADRTRRLTADDSGEALNLTLPAPAAVADSISLPGVESMRRGSALLTRPVGEQSPATPIGLADIAEALRAALAELPRPERPGAFHLPYPALYRAGRLISPGVEAYLLDVARAYRDTRPVAPAAAPRPKAPSGPALSPAEQRARSRAQLRADERETVAFFLDGWLVDDDPDDPFPLGRMSLSDLWDLMDERVEDYADDGETLPSGRPLRVPPRRSPNFLEPVEARLGDRFHTRSGAAIEIRPEHLTPPARSITDGAALDVLAAVREDVTRST